MKKILFLAFILCSFYSFGQIGLTNDFESGLNGWTTSGYFSTSTVPCDGTTYIDNLWSSSTTGSMTSPDVTTSNGTDITVVFDYKILDYASFGVGDDPTTGDWGTLVVEYSTNSGTNWTNISTIDMNNHIPSASCATVTNTIAGANVPNGSNFQLRFVGTWASGDYYVYLDNISATQVAVDPPSCDAVLTTPTDGATDVDPDAAISWSAATGVPTGYFVNIGTAAGATDVANMADAGNSTTYTHPTALPANQLLFVTIIPYNDNGNATGCAEESFTTSCAVGGGSLAVDATNCATDMYSIFVDITSIGSADSYNITTSDANGSTETEVGVGMYTLTGFTGASGTVTVTLTPVPDAPDCVLSSLITIPTGCAPANDDCANATVLNCGDELLGQTTANASDNGDDVGCTTGRGVWYSFAGDGNDITVTVTDPTFDAEIAVASSTDCTTFTNVVCRDGSVGTETVTFSSTIGTTYYIYIGHYLDTSTSTGDFDISIECNCPNPPVFTLADGTNNCPTDEIFIDVDVTDLGTTTSVDISADGTTYETGVGVGTYSIGPFPSGTAVNVVVTDNAGPNCSSDANITPSPCPPANDECANAIALNCGDELLGQTTVSSSDNGDDVGCTTGRGVWYSFAGDGNDITVTVANPTFDAEIAIASSTDCTTFTNVDCRDGSVGTETVTFSSTIGTTYYIYIGHYLDTSTSTGDFDISIECNCPNPPVFTLAEGTNNCPTDEIFIDVDVTDLGTATSVDISVDGTTAETGVGVGTYTVGPFPSGTAVNVEVADNADLNCSSDASITPAPCPPVNDDCANAIALNCGDELLGQTTISSSDNGDDVGCASGNGVWYSFVGDGNEITVTIDPTFDAEIAIASSTDCTTFTNVVCRDGTGSGVVETVTFSSTVGTTYYIYIAYYQSGSIEGDFDISIDCNCANPPVATVTEGTNNCPTDEFFVDVDVTALGAATTVNVSANGTTYETGVGIGMYTVGPFAGNTDVNVIVSDAADMVCRDETDITVGSCPPVNDLCVDAIALSCGTISGTTLGANGASGTSCTGTINDNVWYSFVGDGNDYDLSVLGLDGFTVQIDVYESSDGTCDNITCNGASVDPLGGNPATTTLSTVDGTTYYIAIGYWSSSGTVEGDFEITLVCPPDNDLCADAQDISTEAANGGMVMGTTIGATDTDAPADCAASPLGAGVWYSITNSGSEANINITCDAGNTIYVYEGTACSPTACAPNATGQGTNDVTFNTEGNAPSFVAANYAVYVAGASQDFTLNITNTAPLAVELTNFSGYAADKTNVLEWATANEVDAASFIVERSFNGRAAWQKVGTVAATNRSNSTSNYSLVDANPTAFAYYRLISTDVNGQSQASDVITIERKGEVDVQVYPVPAQDQVSVDFNGNDGESVNIYITDVAGRLVKQVQLDTTDGLNQVQVNISELADGIYFLTLDNGTAKATNRIVKQ